MMHKSAQDGKSFAAPRSGFTVMETVVALGVMTIAMMLVAQLGYWSLRQRVRTAARQVAIELAANTLESARARPWEDLTPEWAASQRIPQDLDDELTEGELLVRVEPEASQHLTQRVTVEVTWLLHEDIRSQPVRLVGLFTARSVTKKGRTQ